MKKIAIRGLIVLAIVIACSMFFANTILTITTPKVKFAQVGYKRFEEQITLNGELYFDQTDSIILESAKNAPVTIDTMYVRVGDRVAEGDTIATTRLADSFQEQVEEAQDALVAARDAYMKNEIDNIKLVENIDSDKNEAYRHLTESTEALAEAQATLLGEAAKKGIILPEDTSKWAAEIQKTGDDDLIVLMEDVLDKSLTSDEASEAFLNTYATSKTKTALYEFINKRQELQKEVDKAQQKLIEMVASGEALTTIRAEHDGYITVLNIEKGKVYDGSMAAYEITKEGEAPVLRVDVTGDNRREYTEGMRVDIPTEYRDLRAEVNSIVREGVDKRYLYVNLDDDTITQLGGVRSLLDTQTPVKITYRGKTNTTVLPAGVVRDEGENNSFVWVAEYNYGGWFGSEMIAKKTPVTVIDRGDKEVSVQEDLRNTRPIFQEDKSLADGKRVMEYLD